MGEVRVECEGCQTLVAARFAADPGGVRASCPACGRVMVVALSPASAIDGDAAARCPKCGAARTAATACPSCGLTAARMAGYQEALDAAVPRVVREAWAHALDGWSEPARHDALIQQVAAHNSYAWAAGRYRTRAPDPIADRQLDRLRRAAEATLLASATVRRGAETKPYRATTGVLAILIVAVVVGLLYSMVSRGSAAGPGPAVSPARMPAGLARPLTPGHPVSPSTVK